MRPFTETPHCRSGVHCRTCRDREGGRAWRQRIARVFEADGTDWPCPRGRPWGYEGPSRGLGDTAAKAISTVTGGRLKPCGGCRKRREQLNRFWPYRRADKEA